jgi:aldehyde dehydrogenase (NAD+)
VFNKKTIRKMSTIIQVRDFTATFDKMSENQLSVARTSARERIEKLKKLETAIWNFHGEIKQALMLDFQKTHEETDVSEMLIILREIRDIKRQLYRWMRPQDVSTPLILAGTSSQIHYEAKGVCLIISPWNYPVNLSLVPLISAVAAGNCVVLKPSELTPHTSRVLSALLASVFPQQEVAVIEGGVEVSTELLKLPFNHIFFTGAPSIGKVVMRAAAENLASVTLELGGKSPAIVDETANLNNVAQSLVGGKFLNGGQTCIAPDYILVHESCHDALILKLKAHLLNMYGTEQAQQENPRFARMVNSRHYQRVKNYLDDAVLKGGKVETGGVLNERLNYISPTIISQVSDDMLLMQEEIFGPILPIKSYKNLEEAVAYIRKNEKPLSMYIFSKKKANRDFILKNTSTGGVTINDFGLHFVNEHLPFGGINNSGMGRCHGEEGFRSFSNAKSVSQQHLPFPTSALFFPPFNGFKRWLLRTILKWG